jgi:hypothetical protein
MERSTGGRRPGRSGWAGAHGCARRRPVCGPFPRLGFAARGRCGPSRETRQGSQVAPWDSRRGRALDCAQGTTSAGHLARRRAGGGRDANWRMRVAAVACCEAADRVANSATPCAATPRPLDTTLACHRRPTSTRRRPTTVSTRAQRRHNGASVSRTLTEYSRATPHALGVDTARLRELTENAACACGVRSIGRVDTTGCASVAGPTTAGASAGRERMG